MSKFQEQRSPLTPLTPDNLDSTHSETSSSSGNSLDELQLQKKRYVTLSITCKCLLY